MPVWLTNVLLVGAGGGLGSIARYGITLGAQAAFGPRFPIGTLIVNVAGCIAAGALGHLILDREAISMQLRLVLATGFLGGLTTFSSFGYETGVLVRAGDLGLAGINIGANVVLSLAGVWLGWALARAVWPL